jgi:hypothetical protein
MHTSIPRTFGSFITLAVALALLDRPRLETDARVGP